LSIDDADEVGFGDHEPLFMREAAIRAAIAKHGNAIAQRLAQTGKPTAADNALRLALAGNLDGARAAAKTRAERWPAFRMAPELSAQLWPDTGSEFASTVRMFGEPSGW
jgi:hypothetical protein